MLTLSPTRSLTLSPARCLPHALPRSLPHALLDAQKGHVSLFDVYRLTRATPPEPLHRPPAGSPRLRRGGRRPQFAVPYVPGAAPGLLGAFSPPEQAPRGEPQRSDRPLSGGTPSSAVAGALGAPAGGGGAARDGAGPAPPANNPFMVASPHGSPSLTASPGAMSSAQPVPTPPSGPTPPPASPASHPAAGSTMALAAGFPVLQ